MSIERHPFGKTPTGKPVERFVLRSGTGLSASIITYGGRITELHTPDRNGNLANINLGFDTLEPYFTDKAFLGTLVGRVANRIGGARFTLDGKEYHFSPNDGHNLLHGGPAGFHQVVWIAEPRDTSGSPALWLSYTSPDGEGGFPGTLRIKVGYTLSADALRIDYTATTDKPTPINLTNHAYFNLSGAGGGDILSHELTLAASRYTPVDEELIPMGTVVPLDRTPLDFRRPIAIGQRIGEVGIGYDHNYVLDTNGDLTKLAGTLRDPGNGRIMRFYTTELAVQLYTGNFLQPNKHGALCLETQHFPDAVNHPEFPSTILRPGKVYKQSTIYQFASDR